MLAASEQANAVLGLRSAVTDAMHDALVECVEEATGCRVLALNTGVDPAADVASCVFLMDRPIVPGPAAV
jgi:uncharacterized protein YbcI